MLRLALKEADTMRRFHAETMNVRLHQYRANPHAPAQVVDATRGASGWRKISQNRV
jgi:hypothetical protein